MRTRQVERLVLLRVGRFAPPLRPGDDGRLFRRDDNRGLRNCFRIARPGLDQRVVDKPIDCGLQPETFASFIGQRSRWCQGMFQILLLKNPGAQGRPALHPDASLISHHVLLFPLPRLIFMFAPLTYIFFDVKIFVSNIDEAMAYTAMYVVVNAMLQNYLFGKVRWPWMSNCTNL